MTSPFVAAVSCSKSATTAPPTETTVNLGCIPSRYDSSPADQTREPPEEALDGLTSDEVISRRSGEEDGGLSAVRELLSAGLHAEAAVALVGCRELRHSAPARIGFLAKELFGMALDRSERATSVEPARAVARVLHPEPDFAYDTFYLPGHWSRYIRLLLGAGINVLLNDLKCMTLPALRVKEALNDVDLRTLQRMAHGHLRVAQGRFAGQLCWALRSKGDLDTVSAIVCKGKVSLEFLDDRTALDVVRHVLAGECADAQVELLKQLRSAFQTTGSVAALRDLAVSNLAIDTPGCSDAILAELPRLEHALHEPGVEVLEPAAQKGLQHGPRTQLRDAIHRVRTESLGSQISGEQFIERVLRHLGATPDVLGDEWELDPSQLGSVLPARSKRLIKVIRAVLDECAGRKEPIPLRLARSTIDLPVLVPAASSLPDWNVAKGALLGAPQGADSRVTDNARLIRDLIEQKLEVDRDTNLRFVIRQVLCTMAEHRVLGGTLRTDGVLLDDIRMAMKAAPATKLLTPSDRKFEQSALGAMKGLYYDPAGYYQLSKAKDGRKHVKLRMRVRPEPVVTPYLEIGEIVWATMEEMRRGRRSSIRHPALLIAKSGRNKWQVLSFTSELDRPQEHRRLPHPARLGLSHDGYVWHERQQIYVRQVKEHIGWVVPDLIEVARKPAKLRQSEIAELKAAAQIRHSA